MNQSTNDRREPFDHDAPVGPGQECARFAPLLPLFDEHALGADDERRTRAHLMGCAWCQAQRASYAVADVALRRYVGALMAETPVFSEEEIMRLADDNRTPLARHATNPTTRSLPPLAATAEPPLSPTRDTRPSPRPPTSRRRRFLSSLGAVAAALLIVALAVAIFAPRLARGHNPTTGAQPSPTSSLAQFTVYAQDGGGKTYAFRASDGALEKTFDPAPINGFGTAVFAQGVIYQLSTNAAGGNDTASAPTFLSATRLHDGAQLWRRQLTATFTPYFSVVNGVIYLDSSFPGTTSQYYNPATVQAVFAYRASNGALLWRQTLPNALISPPVVSDGVVYAAASDFTGADGGTQIIALRASNGAQLWSTPISTLGDAPVSAWGTATGDSVYWHVALLNASSQTIPNTNKENDPVEVIALRATDGLQRWQVTLGSDMFIGDGPFAPVVANGIVYDRIASWGGSASNALHLQLFALRATNGSQMWKFEDDNSSSSLQANIYEPAVVNGVLYVTEDDGSLIALQATSGVQRWRVNTSGVDNLGGGANTPVFADGVLFVASGLYVVAVRADNGQEIWREYARNPGPLSVSNLPV